MSCFNTNKANAFDPNLLEPLLKVLRLSPSVAASLAKAEMYAGIAQKLGHKKAVVRLNLLRLVRNMMDISRESGMGPGGGGNRQLRALFDFIQTLADKDSAVLVRNLASELVRSHIDADVDARSLGGVSTVTSSSRSRSGPRRTTSYTPPGLQSSTSAPPMTPTHHGHRPSQSAAAYIEVAATPRRSAVATTHERDAALYRPRSRDGGSASSSIPRRVSGDVTTNGSLSSRSRLPRQSTSGPGRPSLSLAGAGPAIVSRSESSLSNKENVGRVAAVERMSATGSGSGSGRDAARRRTRAPSTDVKWS